jgi:hypothetical protein
MTPAREQTRMEVALRILGGYLTFTAIVTAALLVIKFVVAVQSLASALSGGW